MRILAFDRALHAYKTQQSPFTSPCEGRREFTCCKISVSEIVFLPTAHALCVYYHCAASDISARFYYPSITRPQVLRRSAVRSTSRCSTQHLHRVEHEHQPLATHALRACCLLRVSTHSIMMLVVRLEHPAHILWLFSCMTSPHQ
jgi:hypothetical protein